jgi:MFS family permease
MFETSARQFSLISILWLPVTLFWSAVMAQVLAERVEHFTGEQKGLYMAVIGAFGAIAATVVQLVVGPVSDNCPHPRGRRYPFILWGILLNTIPLMTFALSRSFAALMVSFVFIQLFINLATGPFQAIIPDLVPPEHQGKASGWMGFWTLIGQIAGLILSGLLLAKGVVNRLTGQQLPPAQEASVGVFLICVICAVGLLVCLFINLRAVKEKPLPKSAALPVSAALREAWDLQLRRYPDFAKLLYSRFIINMGIYTGIEFLRYYVQDALPQGGDVALETMFIALAATFGGVLGAFKAGSLADRASKRTLIYVSCGFAALAAVLFCITSSVWAARGIGFIFGIGYGAFCAVDWAFATNLMPPGKEAKYMAIFHIAFTVPQVLILVWGGVMGHHFGYRAVFWTIPFYLALGTAMISKVRERHEIPVSREQEFEQKTTFRQG